MLFLANYSRPFKNHATAKFKIITIITIIKIIIIKIIITKIIIIIIIIALAA